MSGIVREPDQGGPGAALPGGDPDRVAVAAALRRLAHAVVAHDADPELLRRVARQAVATAEIVEAAPSRHRQISEIKRQLWLAEPAEGPIHHFDECVVSGRENPMGIGIRVQRVGDEARAAFRLGPAFEGAPGRAHGGVVAAIFDDVMGYVPQIVRSPAYTRELTVTYLRPTPVGVDLTARAWLERREDRKLWVAGEVVHDEEVVATGRGMFIAIPLERLGLTAADIAGGEPAAR